MIARAKFRFAVCVVSLLSTSTVHAQPWTPPIGIPMPSFGIFETAPASPSPWIVPTTGFYYVDATSAASTDTSNPLGTPATPRKSIPNALPAGSVVELHGTYDRNHESPNTIVASGTVAAPVFIRGTSPSTRPLIRSGWEVKGTYVILENLDFGPNGQSQTGVLVLLSPINHAALRHSNMHGNLNAGGMAVVSWDGALNQNVVVFNNTIHDNGDVNASFDQDNHGITVGARVSNLWVVDNQMYLNSGDGIQINADTAGNASTHHIYVGRNVAYSNKQTGFWSKQATDVVFSQNVCRSHRPGNSSNGQCMGYQYAPQYVWFLFNTISDSDYGIVAYSDHVGTVTESFFVGNVIHNIHPADGLVKAGDSWASAAIMLAGGTNRKVIHNTIYDVNAGVNVGATGGSLEVRDNIISRVVASANHLFVEDASLAGNTTFHHNLLEGDPRVRLGGPQQHLTAAQLTAMQSFGVDPLFVNPAAANFHVQATSKAVDTGDAPSAYTIFQQRYGLNIARDPEGNALPSGVAPDMGAFEQGGCIPSVPGAPTGLTSVVTGVNVSMLWMPPTSCNAPTSYWLEGSRLPGGASFGGANTGSTATSLAFAVGTPQYFYARMKSSNASGMSTASNEVLVSVGVPGPPASLVGTVTGTTINLSWQAPSGGIVPTGYVLDVGSAAGRTDKSVSLTASRTTFTATGSLPGTYYIRIRASAGGKAGAPSNEVSLTVR